MKKIKDEELIEDLKRVKEMLGYIPSGADYQKYGKYSPFPYKKRETWNNWLISIFGDISLKEAKRDMKKIKDEELIEDLKRVGELINGVPTKKTYIEYGNYGIYRYDRKKWITWCELTFGKNCKRTNTMKIPYMYLIDDLKRVAELINKIPTVTEYGEHGNYCPALYRKQKSWKEWLYEIWGAEADEIGTSNKPKTRQDLVNNLLGLYERLGRVPKQDDLILGKYSRTSYMKEFGSFNEVLMALDLKPNLRRDISKEEGLEELKRVCSMLMRRPTADEFIKHSSSSMYDAVCKYFERWGKALEVAGFPIKHQSQLTKEEIIRALNNWYIENDKDVRCLEYWAIRKAYTRGEFICSCSVISKKFGRKPWEEIIRECGFADYKTINQFIQRGSFPGKDNNIYLSSLELQVGNLLYDLLMDGRINGYVYEAEVCAGKQWSCDFKIETDNGELWLETDGLRNNRKDPYNSGHNEKIEYYKANGFNFEIISYVETDIKKKIETSIKQIS